MNNTQLEEKQIVNVSGQGSSKQAAIADALSKISKEIMKQHEVTIQITPETIDILNASHVTYTERFLFIFFPRKREIFKVDLAVTVNTKYMDLTQVDFEEVSGTDPNGIQLPKFFLKSKTNRS